MKTNIFYFRAGQYLTMQFVGNLAEAIDHIRINMTDCKIAAVFPA